MTQKSDDEVMNVNGPALITTGALFVGWAATKIFFSELNAEKMATVFNLTGWTILFSFLIATLLWGKVIQMVGITILFLLSGSRFALFEMYTIKPIELEEVSFIFFLIGFILWAGYLYWRRKYTSVKPNEWMIAMVTIMSTLIFAIVMAIIF